MAEPGDYFTTDLLRLRILTMIAALCLSAYFSLQPEPLLNVVDLEVVPVPVARLETSQGRAGGVVIRTTPGQPESVDISFLDDQGADLSQAAQRKLERVFARGEFRRASPGGASRR